MRQQIFRITRVGLGESDFRAAIVFSEEWGVSRWFSACVFPKRVGFYFSEEENWALKGE